MRKDLLLVTDIFPPHIGGPATFINELAHEMSRIGRRVSVICSSDRPVETTDKDLPFKVSRIWRGYNSLSFNFSLGMKLFFGALSHRRVFTNGLEYQTQAICSALGKPYFLKIVGDIAWERIRASGQTELDVDQFQTATSTNPEWNKLVARRNKFAIGAKLVIVPSNYLKKMVHGWGVPAEKIHVIYNGVNIESFSGFTPKSRDSKTLRLIFIGRLTNWKGVDTLLIAMSRLSNVFLDIVGDGPELGNLKSLAMQMELQQSVKFHGRQSIEQTRAIARQSHGLVLLSEYEGLSHTLIEAAAMGIPVIASNRGGNSEVVIHNVTGLLIPVRDVAALIKSISLIRDDETFRSQLAGNAKNHSDNFQFSATLNRTVSLLADN